MSSISNAKQQTSPYWNLAEEEDEKVSYQALSLMTDSVKFQVLKAVIDLNVFEIIKNSGPGARLSAAEIVTKLPASDAVAAATVLGRLLDFLVSHSILSVTPITLADNVVERHYGLTPVCKFFTLNEDGVSLAPFVDTSMHKVLQGSSLCFKDAVLEGVEPFNKAHGSGLYEYIGKHPDYQRAFHNAMSNHSTLVLRKILKTYKGFEGLSSLVDVGGGNGTTLTMIVSQYPSIKGINFDQPHVIAEASPINGVEHVGGDMFVSVPKGDAIFLKWICHCFNDEACIRILTNCHAAIPEEHGKVIICEYLLPEPTDTLSDIAASSVVQFNVIMMASPGGQERTEIEFRALARAAGFQDLKVVCSAYNVKIIELFKKN